MSVPIPILFPTRASQVLKVSTFSLLLNIFQSVDVRYPSSDAVACERANTPERLLYVSGTSTESDVRDIFVASVPESTLTVPERDEREPERVTTVVLRVDTVPERVFREPEMVLMLVSVVLTRPERVAMFPVAVERLVLIPVIVPERAFCARAFVK